MFRQVLILSLLTGGCGPSMSEVVRRDQRIQELEAEAAEEAATRASLEGQVGGLNARSASLQTIVDRLSEDATALQQDRESLAQSYAVAQAAMASLEEDRAGLRTQLDSIGRALEEVRAREQRARARLETFRGMLEQLRAMIDSGDLRVRVVRNRMVVELPEGVLFDTGRAEIRDGGQAILSQLAPILTSLPDREFQVSGHTDNRPIQTRRFPSNWELSSARALIVARFLMEQGLPAERISASAYADTQAVGSNETEEGRQQNRRIEIVLLPNLDELPDLSALQRAVQTP